MSTQTVIAPTENTKAPTKVGLLVFRGFEPLDAFGPIEALQTLSLHTKLDLVVIGPSLDPVSTALRESSLIKTNSTFAFSVVPTHTYDAPPEDLEVLIVPGGEGVLPPDEAVLAFLRKTYPKLKYLLGVCNGSGAIAAAGILDGRRATTTKDVWQHVVALGPKVEWVKTARYIVDGNIWTSSGVSAGIDSTLAWMAHIWGSELARRCANIMEYEWKNDPSWDPFSFMFSEDRIASPI